MERGTDTKNIGETKKKVTLLLLDTLFILSICRKISHNRFHGTLSDHDPPPPPKKKNYCYSLHLVHPICCKVVLKQRPNYQKNLRLRYWSEFDTMTSQR